MCNAKVGFRQVKNPTNLKYVRSFTRYLTETNFLKMTLSSSEMTQGRQVQSPARSCLGI